jgi:hypothetical protein
MTNTAMLTDGRTVQITDRLYTELTGWRAGETTLAAIVTTDGRTIAASHVSYII